MKKCKILKIAKARVELSFTEKFSLNASDFILIFCKSKDLLSFVCRSLSLSLCLWVCKLSFFVEFLSILHKDPFLG